MTIDEIKDIKAFQGYESRPMVKFNFLKQHNLSSPISLRLPLVVFGCYKEMDYAVVNNHKSVVIVMWCGSDSLIADKTRLTNKKIIHVTNMPRIQKQLMSRGIKSYIIHTVARHRPKPLLLGNKVYTYLHHAKPEYHGKTTLGRLKLDYPVLVGDGSIKLRKWSEVSDSWYGQCFAGLFLSDYVGGGISIQEMGLRGIPVVSNVIEMPHVIGWKTLKEVRDIMDEKAKDIGKINTELAEQVYNYMIKKVRCFNLGQLIKDDGKV